MAAVLTPRAFDDVPEATGRTSKAVGVVTRPPIRAGAGMAAFAFLVGTGGLCTRHYLVDRDAKGYRIPSVDWRSRQASDHAAAESGAATALATIRRMLPVSITQLA